VQNWKCRSQNTEWWRYAHPAVSETHPLSDLRCQYQDSMSRIVGWQMNWKAFGWKQSWPNRSTIPACDWRDRGKPWKISVTKAGVLGIQTDHPHDTSTEHYGYPSLLGYKNTGWNSSCVLSHTVPHPRGFSGDPVWPRVMVAPGAPGHEQNCAASALTFFSRCSCTVYCTAWKVSRRLWNRFRCKHHFI
jgi:hypothetical protein